MDERLEKALDFSNFMVTVNNQRKLIYEKFLENSVYYERGGKFVVNKELINFCNTLLQKNQTSAIFVDDNNTPIEIDDLEEFLDKILNVYFTNVNEYLIKFNELKEKRTSEGLLNI
ncbi:uncharacterized protein METZ01_LOCUS303745 [marine metagenome]|uniref:Uncharacterized protein n=1 Tax=marine metagenome TaxID=408172 RepID=A0A382MU66_9ZZZZ